MTDMSKTVLHEKTETSHEASPERTRRFPGWSPAQRRSLLKVFALCGVMLFFAYLFAFSNPEPEAHFDYQFRVATTFLSGKVAMDESVSWLSEMIPFEGHYYTAFPLGSVLCMMPVAILQKLRGVPEFPVREVIAWVAGTTALFVAMLSGRYRDPLVRRGMLTSLVMVGSWLWCNLAFGNAWELAIGVAALGEFGALAFTLKNRQPLLAGLCFAVAFGNRTEIVLTAPFFLYLLLRHDPFRDAPTSTTEQIRYDFDWRKAIRPVVEFCLFPFFLGVATLWYNYIRFHHFLDFGYTHIPHMMQEEWYRHGIFSLYCLPLNINFMLLASSWEPLSHYPFLRPMTFGGSIFSACPYLLLLMREGGRDRALRFVCWCAITVLSITLMLHGNAGGVQFSYRYALVLLPWLYLLWLDQRGGKVTILEWCLYGLSLLSNAWAVYMFFWVKATWR